MVPFTYTPQSQNSGCVAQPPRQIASRKTRVCREVGISRFQLVYITLYNIPPHYYMPPATKKAKKQQEKASYARSIRLLHQSRLLSPAASAGPDPSSSAASTPPISSAGSDAEPADFGAGDQSDGRDGRQQQNPSHAGSSSLVEATIVIPALCPPLSPLCQRSGRQRLLANRPQLCGQVSPSRSASGAANR